MARANPNERQLLPVFTGSETGAMQDGSLDLQRNLNPKQRPQETPPNGGARTEGCKEICRSLSPRINPKQVPHDQRDPRHSDESQVSLLPSLGNVPVPLSPGVNPKDLSDVSPTGNLTSSSPGLLSPLPHRPVESDPFFLSAKDLQTPPTAQLGDTGPGFTMHTDVVSIRAKQTQLEASASQTTANASAEDSTPHTPVDPQAHHSPSSAAHDPSQAGAMTQNGTDTSLEQRPCHDPPSAHDGSQAKRYYPKENILITLSLPKNDVSAVSSVTGLPNKTSSNIFQSKDGNNFMADKNHENNSSKFDQIIPERTGDRSLLGGHNFSGKTTCPIFGSQSGRADQNNYGRTETKHSKLASTPSASRKGSRQKEHEHKCHLNPSAAVSHASAETAQLGRPSAIPNDVCSNLCPTRFPNVPPETAAKSWQSPRESCVEKPDEVDHTKTTGAANTVSTAAKFSRSPRETCVKKPAELDYARTVAAAGTVNSAADFSRRSRETCAEKPEEVEHTRKHSAGDKVASAAELDSPSYKQPKASSQTVLPEVKRGPETASVGDLAALTIANSSASGAEDSKTSASSLTCSVSSTTGSPLNSDKFPAVSPNSQLNAGSPEDPEASNQKDVSLTGPHGGREHLSNHARTTPLESSSSPTPQEVVAVPIVSDSEQRRPVMVSDYSGNDSLAAGHSDQTVQGCAPSSPFVQLQSSQTLSASDGASGQRTHRLSSGHSPEPGVCVRHKMSSSDSHSRVAAMPPVDAMDPGTPADPPAREARPPSTLSGGPDSFTLPVISVREGKELLQKLEEENAALKEKRTCRICNTGAPDQVPSRCRHLICLQCHLKLEEGKCPFCRERNSLVWKALRGDERGPQPKLDLFTPAGDRTSTFVLPPARTADDQVLAELPPALRMHEPQTREDFDLHGTRTASRTQLLDLSLKMGKSKVPANTRMGTVECRNESFRVFQPETPCPMELAKAGLFGDQHQDHPQCFHCGGGVVVEGDPVTCHAQQFPNCDYLNRHLPAPKHPEFSWRRFSQ